MFKNVNATLSLAVFGLFSLLVYSALVPISRAFEYSDPVSGRPILLTLALFALLFVLYVFAIIICRTQKSRWSFAIIVLFAVVFRGVMLFSTPIQEVDIYRYIWDGVLVANGHDPFAYAPGSIPSEASLIEDQRIDDLIRLRDSDPSIRGAFDRVHFKQLPTVYPAVSQGVFALSAMTTPGHQSLELRMLIMKLWIVFFDLGTLGVVVLLLRSFQLPASLCVVYGWCPLLMKEFANSGHLDSIAVFFATLAVYLLVRSVTPFNGREPIGWVVYVMPTLAGVALAFGVGAKIFPIVLFPLFFAVVWRRISFRAIVVPVLACSILSILFLAPMLRSGTDRESEPLIGAVEPIQPSDGIRAFLQSWEINDLVFMAVVENLKPAQQFPENSSVWFSVVPDSIRQSIFQVAIEKTGWPPQIVPFMVTRLITTLVFVLIAVWLAFKAAKGEPKQISVFVFLTLAWFWILSPTQNPWYWSWALPFLAFMNNRAWYAISGVVFLYYLRFWFEYEFTNQPVIGTPYHGVAFFDFVIPWIEFGPILIWVLFVSRFGRRRQENQLKLES